MEIDDLFAVSEIGDDALTMKEEEGQEQSSWTTIKNVRDEKRSVDV